MKEKEVYTGFIWQSHVYMQDCWSKVVYAYTCIFMHKITHSCGKAYFQDHGIWTYGFGPWYCIWSIEPRFWVPSIGSLWFWTMVWVRPKTIKRRRSFGKGIDLRIEYLMKSKICNIGDRFMVYNWIWIKEEPEHKKTDKFYWWIKTQVLNSSIFVWFWSVMTWSINIIV